MPSARPWDTDCPKLNVALIGPFKLRDRKADSDCSGTVRLVLGLSALSPSAISTRTCYKPAGNVTSTVPEIVTILCNVSLSCRECSRFLNPDYLKVGMRWWVCGTELQEDLGLCEDTGSFSLLFPLLKLFLWKHIRHTNTAMLQLIWCLVTHGLNFVTILNLTFCTSGLLWSDFMPAG